MLRWLASGMTEAGIEIWFGENASGWIELYELKNDAFVSVAHNPDPQSSLTFQTPPKYGVREMAIKTIAAEIGGKDVPVFIAVSQGGAIVAADDGLGNIQNGHDPHKPFEFPDLAKYNSPTYFYFNVKFS